MYWLARSQLLINDIITLKALGGFSASNMHGTMRAKHWVPDSVHSPGGNIVFLEKGNIVFPEPLLSPCYIGRPSAHCTLSKKPSPFSRRPLDSQGPSSLYSTWVNKSIVVSTHTQDEAVEGHTVHTIHILKASCSFRLNSPPLSESCHGLAHTGPELSEKNRQ